MRYKTSQKCDACDAMQLVCFSFMKSPTCSIVDDNHIPFGDPDFTEILTLNISGKRFQTYRSTLERYPDTLLGNAKRRARYYNAKKDEFFFDRHRKSFDSILYYYQSEGILRRPRFIAMDTFVREITFFELGADVIAQFWTNEGYVKPEGVIMPKKSWQKQVWILMEHPDKSVLARCIGLFSLFVILLSTITFCLETLPYFKAKSKLRTANGTNATAPRREICGGSFQDDFFVIEVACIIWFTLEFILRIISAPSKKAFCKGIMNWVDFVAIVPFYVNCAIAGNAAMSFSVLRVLRLFRVFRIFKLSRHSRGLRILFETFKASVRELCLLVFLIMIAMILFSSVIYYAESFYFDTDDPHNQFTSIPQGFWFTLVTMTTVGYGDITPKGPVGRIVGITCALIGVLVIALPVPVIVENFKHFYRQERRITLMESMKNDETKEHHEQEPNSVSTASL